MDGRRNFMGSQSYVVNGFRYRPLIPIILAKLKDSETSDHFHIVPSELRWQPGEGEEVRVYSDLYHSDAFLHAYRDIQLLPPESDQDTIPRCIVALMFSSDETMLTSFGNAKLWPVYMLFGNETKYRRGKVSLRLFEEVAYFQSLPDAFHDWYLQQSGKKVVGDPLLTHIRRELFHAQWKILLDAEFVEAYQHGLVIDCLDGVCRRFYPRILTYSADYPERVTVVEDIEAMGTQTDRMYRDSQLRVDDESRRKQISTARHSIYETNYSVNAKVVEKQLKASSLVPAQNAFSERLSSFGFDMYSMLAVDILHEVEIGIWKSLFIHLLRLLEAIDTASIGMLNSRFRQMPTFGRDTIRRFSKNVSDRKQFGAREYEDTLQCAMVAFEGLFPDEHDGIVQALLYTMAQWHSFAKLRMHTDPTLAILDSWTTILGNDARTFTSVTCVAFKARELKKEYEARKRAEARKRSHKAPTEGPGRVNAPPSNADASGSSTKPSPSPSQSTDGRRDRTWNLSTPKFHGLGDVVSCIKRFGTTDSYSTQMSERFHVFPKSQYRRTNKKDVPKQLSRIQARQARIKKLRRQLYPSAEERGQTDQFLVSTHAQAGTPPYFIGRSQNSPVNLSHFLRLHANDLATKGFMHKLKHHLVPRVVETLINEAQAQPERYSASLAKLKEFAQSGYSNTLRQDADNTIYFHSEKIYRHNILQILYTTYDCRQDCDTLNPSTSRRDFMSVAMPADNPEATESTDYVYGRLLGIFHANVLYMGPGAFDYRRRRFDFLWVRWYEPVTSTRTSAAQPTKELDRVRFIPLTKTDSWGFIDPSHVLRAAHILPRFALGQLHRDAVPGRIFSKCAREREDWKEYCINRFVDRDMTMRFYPGLGVGHSLGRHGTFEARSRPATPMDVDVPVLEARQVVSSELDEGSTDSEDSGYEGGGGDDQRSPSTSGTEDSSECVADKCKSPKYSCALYYNLPPAMASRLRRSCSYPSLPFISPAAESLSVVVELRPDAAQVLATEELSVALMCFPFPPWALSIPRGIRLQEDPPDLRVAHSECGHRTLKWKLQSNSRRSDLLRALAQPCPNSDALGHRTSLPGTIPESRR
ncbi:hypothetical protein NMY22_g15219 [Coprinellus aureogranulatus]|nr:hypothetical protein NMY22_g15219 [Coprinellus aureogranulatus]